MRNLRKIFQHATILAGIFTVPAFANTFTFATAAGAAAAGSPVNSTATITTNANGTISVSLTNNQTLITSVAQNISGFFFTLGFSPAALNTTTTPTGFLVTIGADSTPETTVDPWDLTSSGAVVQLNSLNGFGPDQTIIGPAPYTNAGGSINGNDPHNPFLQQTANFLFAVTGVTASTNVSAASFAFGTTAGVTVPGDPRTVTATPEPAAWTSVLLGLGLVAVGGWRRRRA